MNPGDVPPKTPGSTNPEVPRSTTVPIGAGYQPYQNQTSPQMDAYGRQTNLQQPNTQPNMTGIQSYAVGVGNTYPQGQQPGVNPQARYYPTQQGYYQQPGGYPPQMQSEQHHQVQDQHYQFLQAQQQAAYQQQLQRDQQYQQQLHRAPVQDQQVIPLQKAPSSRYLANQSNISTGFTPSPTYSYQPIQQSPYAQDIYASTGVPQQTYPLSTGQIQPNQQQAVNYCTAQTQTTNSQQGIQSKPVDYKPPAVCPFAQQHQQLPNYNLQNSPSYLYPPFPPQHQGYPIGTAPVQQQACPHAQNYSTPNQAFASVPPQNEQTAVTIESQNALTRTKSQLSLKSKVNDPSKSQSQK